MLRDKLQMLRDTLATIKGVKVYHYWRPQLKAPFIIWAEEDEGTSFHANNKKVNQNIHGVIDFYTKTEYDPVFDEIQNKLNNLDGFSWRWDSTQYENETNLIHHSWDWWVGNGEA